MEFHNSHRDNIGIPKHTQKKTLRLLSSDTNLFYYLWVKRFFHIRRGTIFLCWLFHLPQTTCGARSAQICLASPRSQYQLTDFSQISAHTSGEWRHSHPTVTFLSGVSIVTSLNDTSAPRVREHLRSCLHLTNPCTKRKVLWLTKPKCKIYQTKSLGHYITNVGFGFLSLFNGISIFVGYWMSKPSS